MKASDKKKIEALADEMIAKMMTARSATNDVRATVAAAHAALPVPPPAPLPTPSPALVALLGRSADAHANALAGARAFVTDPQVAGLTSLAQSLQFMVTEVTAALTEASNLRGLAVLPTLAQVDTSREADDEAVTRVRDAKAAFQTEAGGEGEATVVLGLSPKMWLQILVGFAIFAVAISAFWQLGKGLFGGGPLMDKLAQIDYARGMITYLLGVGTVAIALLLVLGALLGSEDSKDNFVRGKEVLTALIGIFGTILGFYYGSAKTEKAPLKISPVAVAKSLDGASTFVTATITGGKPPYAYSIKFKDDALNANMKEKKNDSGRITEVFKSESIPADKAVPFTVTTVDADKNQASSEFTEKDELSGKPHEQQPSPNLTPTPEQRNEKPLTISPLILKKSQDGTTTTLEATISGGKAPYNYSIQFTGDALEPIKDKKSVDGRITEVLKSNNIPGGKSVPFTVTVSDSDNKQASVKTDEKNQLTGKQ